VPRSRRPPSQNWKTFLRNHAAGIASIDLFVVPTAFFKLLYGLVILGHGRRRLIASASPLIPPPNGSPVVFGEAHLRRILRKYAAYYNEVRTHLALEKNAPVRRSVQRIGQVTALPLLGGLHHQYVRI